MLKEALIQRKPLMISGNKTLLNVKQLEGFEKVKTALQGFTHHEANQILNAIDEELYKCAVVSPPDVTSV